MPINDGWSQASTVKPLNIVSVLIFLSCIAIALALFFLTTNPFIIPVVVVLGILFAQSPKIADQWERAVVLRLGKYIGLRGPGLFWIVPLLDRVAFFIDQRVITTSFAAE